MTSDEADVSYSSTTSSFSGMADEPEGNFLTGRMVWTNWDVDQLKAKSKEIEASPQMLTSTVMGWPYQPSV